MVISDEYKFIFIHIPKTGGTSCGEALKKVIRRDDRKHWARSRATKHETLLEVKKRFSERPRFGWPFRPKFDDYLKIAFVRNPWSRLVSVYHYMKESKIHPEIGEISTFDDFVAEMARGTTWLNRLRSMWPQKNFLVDESGKVAVDAVGHYEQLDQDFQTMMRRVGLSVELPHLNASQHKPYHHYYSEQTREIVRQRFLEDIQAFGYEY